MKASKIFIKWIAISLVIQISIYFYLDHFYFSASGNIKITEGKSLYQKKEIKPNVTVTDDCSDISLSSDCGYTAYFQNGVVKVVDTNTGKARGNLNFGQDVQCLAYKWIPDSDRMIIAEKLHTDTGRFIRFYSYDAENQRKEEVKEYSTQKSDSIIALAGSKEKVDMAMSTLTNVMYSKVLYSSGLSAIYRIDANETMTKVVTAVKRIGKIGVASRDDQLVYEDLINSKVRTNTKSRVISINGNSKFKLVGTDDDDNIYVGSGIGNGKVNKIFYGNLSGSMNLWKSVNLNSECSTDNLKIMPNGKIYLIDRINNIVKEIKSGQTINYSGTFVGIYDDGIISIDNSKLKIENVK